MCSFRSFLITTILHLFVFQSPTLLIPTFLKVYHFTCIQFSKVLISTPIWYFPSSGEGSYNGEPVHMLTNVLLWFPLLINSVICLHIFLSYFIVFTLYWFHFPLNPIIITGLLLFTFSIKPLSYPKQFTVTVKRKQLIPSTGGILPSRA